MRPTPQTRWLGPNQRSELVVLDIETERSIVIYDTLELIEAPNWTPDGQWLVYNGDGRLWRISPDGSDGPHRIPTAPVENLNNDHVIAPDGATVFISANDGHLYAVPVAGGVPRRVSHEVEPERKHRYYLHGISPDGQTLAYVALETRDGRTITRIATIPASGGDARYLTDGACPVDGPEYSPDGEWLYFNSEAAATVPGHAQIFRMRPDGTALEQLTNDTRVNWFPHLSPDGQRVSFISFPPGTLGHPANRDVILRLMAPDGGALRDLDAFHGGQGAINVNSWAPDSRRLAYVRYPLAD
jgi:Tol biopolymer transport system component